MADGPSLGPSSQSIELPTYNVLSLMEYWAVPVSLVRLGV